MLYSKENEVIYCEMYLNQFSDNLEVDLKGSKATPQKQDNCSCLMWGLNSGPFSPESSALPSEPSHLVFTIRCLEFYIFSGSTSRLLKEQLWSPEQWLGTTALNC